MGIMERLFKKRYAKCDYHKVPPPVPCPYVKAKPSIGAQTSSDIEVEIKELEDKKAVLVAKVQELSTAIALKNKDQIREAVKNATWTILFIHSTATDGYWSLSSEALAEELKKICEATVGTLRKTIEEAKIFEDFDVWVSHNYVSLQWKQRAPCQGSLTTKALKEYEGVENSARLLSEAIKRADLKIDQADMQTKIALAQSLIDGYKLLMNVGKGD